MIKVVCPKRRYEEIIAMCGPDPVLRSRNLDSECDLVEATIKIPERKFYEVLQADMYTRDNFYLQPNLWYTTQADTSAKEKCFEIKMVSKEQYLLFLGTEKVYNVLHTWKSSCENLQILEETCDSQKWLALTKAPPNHLQAGLDQRTFIRSQLSGGVSMKEPPMDVSAMKQHLEQMFMDYITRRTQDLVISGDQVPGRSVDQCSSPQVDFEKWAKLNLDALGVQMYRSFSNNRDMNVSVRGGDHDEAEPQITTELAESHEVVYEKRYGQAFCELREIGRGSFGTVVEAQNKTDRILYAVKKVLIEPDDDRPIHKILQEVQVLAQLSNDHVVDYKQSWVEEATPSDVNLYSTETQSSQSSVASEDGSATEGAVCSPSGDMGESDVSRKEGIYSLLYIQMELCEESLFDKLYKSPEAWVSDREKHFGTDAWKAEVLKILEQLLEALKYIHSEGIVHTDLKPGNILYDKKRKLYKLCDFGLATRYKRVVSSRDPTSGQTSSSLDLEKYSSPYEAPELLQGGSYSSKGDIYSLGAVLVELLCLFETPEKTDENLRMLRRGDTPSLLELYSTEVTDMVQIVIYMCWTQPERRPTAEDLLKSKLMVTKDTVIRALRDILKEQDRRVFLLLRYIQHLEQKVHLGNTESPV